MNIRMNRERAGTARRAAFTLTELLVVMAVIAVLGGLTAVAVKGISRDARLSTGINTVMSALENARAIAMKQNQPVAVLFRAAWDPDKPRERQRTMIVTAKWTGDTWPFSNAIVDRYVPIQDIAARFLPAGIKVAGPWYDRTTSNGSTEFMYDDLWITQTEFQARLATGEVPGRLFGVVYGPDGTVMGFNPKSNADELFVDYDLDDVQDNAPGDYYSYTEPETEANLNLVPFIAVYDDDDARLRKTLDWSNENNYQQELTGPDGYISRFGQRIHFNRYTGVAMRPRE